MSFSIEERSEQPKSPTSLEIDRLLKRSKFVRSGNPDSALVYATTAFRLAKEAKLIIEEINVLLELGMVRTYLSDFDEAKKHLERAIKLCNEIKNKLLATRCYAYLCNVERTQGQYAKALDAGMTAFDLCEEHGDKKLKALVCNSLGGIYIFQGNYPLALKYLFESLQIIDSAKNKIAQGQILNNIGMIYEYQYDYENALFYYERSLKLKKEMGDKRGMSSTYNNIGLIHYYKSKPLLALEYHNKSLLLREELGDENGKATSYNNIAAAHNELKDYNLALYYNNKALEIYEKVGDLAGIAFALNGIGLQYTSLNKFHEAETHLLKSLKLNQENGEPNQLKESHKSLSALYELTDRVEDAYIHFKLFTILQDSLFNEEKSKKLGKLEAVNEHDLAERKRMSEKDIERKRNAALLTRRNVLQNSAILIFLISLFATIILLGKFAVPRTIINGILFFTFLLIFEFIIVLIDPYVDRYTGQQPAYKLLINSGIVIVIFPLHQIVENWTKQKLLLK